MHSRDPFLAPLHRLMTFSQSVKVKRMVEEIALDPKQTFWIMTINLLLDSATIEWSKVFGSRKDDTHWTKAIPDEMHNDIREGLLKELEMTQGDWESYRDEIIGYRDKMVAHHDLDSDIANFPKFDKALIAANYIFKHIRNYADQDFLGGIPLSLDTWSNTVCRNMQSIVKKAFEASASLGSNVLN